MWNRGQCPYLFCDWGGEVKSVIGGLVLIFGMANASWALSTEEKFVVGLQAQGFTIVEREKTFFGRLRIIAENEKVRREIVVNRNTGEILRDYSVLLTDLADVHSGSSAGQTATADHTNDRDSAYALPAPAGGVVAAFGPTSTADVYVVEKRRGASGDVDEVVIFISPVDVSTVDAVPVETDD